MHFCGTVGVAQTSSNSKPQEEVELIFQNTTKSEVSILGIQPDGKEQVVVERLASNAEISVNSFPSNRWIAKLGNVVMAEYEAGDSSPQVIDLAELASWQLPVEVIFQNDTETSVDVVFVTEKNEEIEYVKGLLPAKQFEQTGSPTGGLWRVKSNSQVVAEYLTDNTPTQIIDLKALIADYAAKVTLTFQNTSTDPVDIYWVHPDGSSILYLPNMPTGMQAEQLSFPGHIWTIRQDGDLIATFVAGDEKNQDVDIFAVTEQLRIAAETMIKSDVSPPKETTNTTQPSRLPPRTPMP